MVRDGKVTVADRQTDKQTDSCLLLQFEYQQAQLEKEVEDLAWAVERAEAGTRGVLEVR